MKKIILASSSPRRKYILKELGIEFTSIKPNYDEVLDNLNFTYEKIENLAYNKVKCVAQKTNEDEIIIGADTVVVLDKKIMGKPHSKEIAKEMLRDLSGRTHFVVTSICAINPKTKQEERSSTTTYVEFCSLTDDMIENYVENFNPLDKAGAYGIQELPDGFVKNIKGSFDNVIGLCSNAVVEVINKFV